MSVPHVKLTGQDEQSNCSGELPGAPLDGHTQGVTSGNPILRKRQLGEILKRARENAELSREAAAAAMEATVVYIGRLERGAGARIKLKDLRALMELYEMPPGARVECERLLSEVKLPGWWLPYTSALRPSFSALLGLEAEASEIHTFEPAIIPGLLQTEDYARAIMKANIPALSADDVERRVKVRLERQARILAVNGPRVHAVLDEAALRRKVGGDEIWQAQLKRLAEFASTAAPRVAVQVLPFEAGAPPATTGPFMLLRLRDSGAWVSFQELKSGDRFGEGAEADVYRLVFDHFMAESARPAMTAGLVESIMREMSA